MMTHGSVAIGSRNHQLIDFDKTNYTRLKKRDEQTVAHGAAGRAAFEINLVRRGPVNGVVRRFVLETHRKMGMHLGLIAAKTSVAKMKDKFLAACPQLELDATKADFLNAEEMWAWKDANEEFVSAAEWSIDTPGKSVFMFWQDGPWALILDPEFTLASDEELLCSLSSELGTVVSFVVESAGGCAFFWCFEKGSLRRRICNNDGEVTIDGDPIAEEAGIDANGYYMDETESLWRAFGIAPYDRFQSPNGCVAISVFDRTDYNDE